MIPIQNACKKFSKIQINKMNLRARRMCGYHEIWSLDIATELWNSHLNVA